ncbi:DUF4058 family protein [Leptothoe kymatousa]|uniref:DUF4058 family protein n=1 Tax=Leptothoe kymatousa TAU-MAC 1615 TaxID=2364775 RepID=A0ABS5XYI5_9CYAN|nr:DUF4058 family protein [Leptothoe kymatousa]MBT9310700.1 DUF4058 family protein [Leptothoe kymatousa TAU-MAC 1615]
MPVMFPGMNPYLEHPDLWPEIHPQFVTALANLLKNEVSDRYLIIIRKRVYRVSGEDSLVVGQSAQENRFKGPIAQNGASSQQPIPTYIAVPQTIQEDYIEIVDQHIGTTVTIVETLTPQKKRPGRGRDNYEQRCEAIFGGDTHFVEIDLLRGWEPISAYGPSNIDYRVLVSRSDQRPKAEMYTWQVNAPIPLLTIPISRSQDGEGTQAQCTVNLKQALDDACAGANYDFSINYERDPIPPLQPDASQWLDNLLGEAGLRQSSQITNGYDEEKLKRRSAHLQA